MSRRPHRRLMALLGSLALALALATGVSASAASAQTACAAPWNAGAVYTQGNVASHNGQNWTAQWWTQGETPGTTGEWGVWRDPVACGGGSGPGDPGPDPSGAVVSEAQFNQMFPNRNSFYTYQGFINATASFPAFGNTGGDTVARQEVAAFLANASHETGGLVHIVEQNQANYPHYCDSGQPYGCPAGNDAYYGRGPVQLSWNFNYNAAGAALGLPLLTNPWLVEQDPTVAWQTALWYWNTQSGPGSMSGHTAMTTGAGFGESIRSINGAIECDGGNPAQVQSRVTLYQGFTGILGVAPGGNLYC
ncbi:glycoside hydrolase family 19 protein [Glycomyces sp. NRRL B-16210]|uniref:glycoside hydrolase family 19 protein n=1 Tax=Glycomyces sp. NRRL B-16210 TaxID=1463821 RepID=UPI0004C1767B|nr:glycoside hydrolase family 19 protein [Glycomyces sp. NRRL B-16210]